ncbi:hypothetical protein BJX64DRAFT_208100 [Aspergillus heterothallicus]
MTGLRTFLFGLACDCQLVCADGTILHMPKQAPSLSAISRTRLVGSVNEVPESVRNRGCQSAITNRDLPVGKEAKSVLAERYTFSPVNHCYPSSPFSVWGPPIVLERQLHMYAKLIGN